MCRGGDDALEERRLIVQLKHVLISRVDETACSEAEREAYDTSEDERRIGYFDGTAARARG